MSSPQQYPNMGDYTSASYFNYNQNYSTQYSFEAYQTTSLIESAQYDQVVWNQSPTHSMQSSEAEDLVINCHTTFATSSTANNSLPMSNESSINSWLYSQTCQSGLEQPLENEDWEELMSTLSPGSIPSCGSPCKSDTSSSRPVTSKWKRKKEFELTLPMHVQKKRRLAANARERKRMTSLNDAFERLREILPTTASDEQDSKPISKMDALQMAQAYIKELSSLLE